MNASLMIVLRRTGFVCPLLSVVVLLLATTSASAGIILQVPVPVASGPGLGTVAVPAIVTIAPNNDNVPAVGVPDNNIFVPIKRFDFNGNIDIVFTVAPSSGVTEYQVFESVDNNTGVDWSGYNMFLGFGSGAGFVPSVPGDGLDFDAPTYDVPPVSSAMPIVVAPNEDTLLFSGGTHGSGAESYQVRIDVPDLATLPPVFSTFTLRQVTIPVPEPSALVLLSIALAGFAAYRSRG